MKRAARAPRVKRNPFRDGILRDALKLAADNARQTQAALEQVDAALKARPLSKKQVCALAQVVVAAERLRLMTSAQEQAEQQKRERVRDAAPSLLAACKGLVAVAEEEPMTMQRIAALRVARHAIACAEGGLVGGVAAGQRGMTSCAGGR